MIMASHPMRKAALFIRFKPAPSDYQDSHGTTSIAVAAVVPVTLLREREKCDESGEEDVPQGGRLGTRAAAGSVVIHCGPSTFGSVTADPEAMSTDEVIASLATDLRRGEPPAVGFARAIAFSALAAGVIFFVAIGFRPDLIAATASVRFAFKFMVTGTAIVAFAFLARASLSPDRPIRSYPPAALAAPLLLMVGVNTELFITPAEEWAKLAIGKNSMNCLSLVPVLGMPPLAILVSAMRRGATVRPGFSGLLAGVLAGAIAATFYAANCTDDSPLFVAVWYPLPIALLGGIGAIAGRLFLRW